MALRSVTLWSSRSSLRKQQGHRSREQIDVDVECFFSSDDNNWYRAFAQYSTAVERQIPACFMRTGGTYLPCTAIGFYLLPKERNKSVISLSRPNKFTTHFKNCHQQFAIQQFRVVGTPSHIVKLVVGACRRAETQRFGRHRVKPWLRSRSRGNG